MLYPGQENSFAKRSSIMNIPSQYKNVDYGKKKKIVSRKVVVKSTGKDNQFYGARAIMTKEDQKLSLVQFLQLNEQDEDQITLLPDAIVAEIKKNITAGAKDLQQKWKNALELVHKGYQVANVRRPTPDQKGGWTQYEAMIKHAVKQLSATRGINGDWRMSSVLIKEQSDGKQKLVKLAKNRFFMKIPGAHPVEVEGDNVNAIIDQLTNKFRRHGVRTQIDQKTDNHVILSLWKDNTEIEQVIIQCI